MPKKYNGEDYTEVRIETETGKWQKYEDRQEWPSELPEYLRFSGIFSKKNKVSHLRQTFLPDKLKIIVIKSFFHSSAS